MLPSLRLIPVALLSASCGLVLDLTPGEAEGPVVEGGAGPVSTTITTSSSTGDGGGTVASAQSSGSGGAGGEVDAEGGGGAGGGPTGPAVLGVLSSTTPGGAVEVQSVVLHDDTTWIAGWFSGASLVHRGAGGVEAVVLQGTDDDAQTTFVVGLDATAAVTSSFAIARAVASDDGNAQVGAHLDVDADGSLYVLSSVGRGSVLLGGVEQEAPEQAFGALIARVDPAGTATWAHRCAATLTVPPSPDPFAQHLSARRGGIAALPDGDLAVAITADLADTIRCVALVGVAPCGPLELARTQGGIVLRLDRQDGTCGADPVAVQGAPGGAVFLDDVSPAADGALTVGGQAYETASIAPWGAQLDAGTAQGFLGRLEPSVTPVAADLHAFQSTGHPAHVASGGWLVGTTPSGEVFEGAAPGADLQLVRADGSSIGFGDPADGDRVEVPTDLVAHGDALLVTGFLSEDASLADDLCGPACSGDLAEVDHCADPAPSDVDAFWLLLPAEGIGAGRALGRALGGCGRQTIAGGAMDDDVIVIVASVEGSATFDLLDGTSTVVVDPGQRSAVVARIPRPTP